MQEVEYSLSHWLKLDFTLEKVDRWDAKRLGGTSSLTQFRHVSLSVLENDGTVVVQIPATVGKIRKANDHIRPNNQQKTRFNCCKSGLNVPALR